MTKPVWPEVINFRSEHAGWKFKPMTESARSDFDAGPARVRRRFTSSRTEQDLSIVLSYFEFELFKGFVDDTLAGASRWFLLPLFQGSVYATTEARFKDAQSPYQASSNGFDSVTVNFTLETRASTVLYDEAAIYVLSLWGQDYTAEFCNQLEILVNTDYPAIWQDNDY